MRGEGEKMEKKEHKYLVLKLDDLREYLTEEGQRDLARTADYIQSMRKQDGREPNPDYIICNQDEPYAEDVDSTNRRSTSRTHTVPGVRTSATATRTTTTRTTSSEPVPSADYPARHHADFFWREQ